jgi:hypothetical protein
VVYDNYGAKGTADKAMAKIKSGGIYLLLPGGEDGALSKHPKSGVKQINFGLMCVRPGSSEIVLVVYLHVQFLCHLVVSVVCAYDCVLCNRDFAIEKSDVDMLASLFEGGHWRAHVDPRAPFSLEHVDQAFTLSKTGTAVGKISIVP